MGLPVTVVDGYDALGRAAADVVEEVVRASGGARIVAATGETPMGLYRELVRRRDEGTFDPSGITVFLLDVIYAVLDPRVKLGGAR